MAGDFGDDRAVEASPPKKRSLFSKAISAKVAVEDEAVEFFSRAKELYPQRLAEEEKKRQKKLAKLERKRSSASAEMKESTPLERKRRRVSAQDGHSSDSSPNHDGNEEPVWTRR